MMPGGNWNTFEPDLRVEERSDQGPWGGTRAYYWRSNTIGYFNKKRVLDWATSSGWILSDSITFKAEEMSGWKEGNTPVFSIAIGPFEPEPSPDEKYMNESFPRWINGGQTLYTFKTDWLIYYPGTDNCTAINGFITLSKDGSEMTLYHLWGE